LDEIVGTVVKSVAPAAKVASRLAKPATAIAAAIEIKKDIDKYDGWDAVVAASLSIGATVLSCGASSAVSTGVATALAAAGASAVTVTVAPVLIGIAVSVVAGVFLGKATNSIKSKLYG